MILDFIFLGLIINFACLVLFVLVCLYFVYKDGILNFNKEAYNVTEINSTILYNLIPFYKLYYVLIFFKNLIKLYTKESFIQIVVKTDKETNIFKVKRIPYWLKDKE